MTRKERVIAAIDHQQTDAVPYSVDLTNQARDRLIEYVGDPGYIHSIGSHITRAGLRQADEVRPGYWRDIFGVVWNRTGADKDIGVVDEVLIPEPSMSCYRFPDIDESRWRATLESTIAAAGDKYIAASIGFAMFERAWSLRGMENILVDMVAEPGFVEELLDAICEIHLWAIDIALEYPIDAVFFGDDWGQQKGLIMGPDYWRKLIKPRMARMYAKAKSAGKKVLQHSCGDNIEIFPDLIEIGLDVYQTFQPEIYDVRAVKREFGRDLTFWGGISTQRALPFLSPEEVKQVTREMISIMSPGGGYIVAPTHAIPGDVPPENIVAMVEVMKGE